MGMKWGCGYCLKYHGRNSQVIYEPVQRAGEIVRQQSPRTGQPSDEDDRKYGDDGINNIQHHITIVQKLQRILPHQ